MIKKILLIILLMFVGCASTEPIQEETKTINIEVNGYIRACTSKAMVYVEEEGWRKVDKELPQSLVVAYVLDGEEKGGVCDRDTCIPVEMYNVEMVEYELIGEQKCEAAACETEMLPVYESKPLSGNVKIELEYYNDAQCEDLEMFSEIVEV